MPRFGNGDVRSEALASLSVHYQVAQDLYTHGALETSLGGLCAGRLIFASAARMVYYYFLFLDVRVSGNVFLNSDNTERTKHVVTGNF